MGEGGLQLLEEVCITHMTRIIKNYCIGAAGFRQGEAFPPNGLLSFPSHIYALVLYLCCFHCFSNVHRRLMEHRASHKDNRLIHQAAGRQRQKRGRVLKVKKELNSDYESDTGPKN